MFRTIFTACCDLFYCTVLLSHSVHAAFNGVINDTINNYYTALLGGRVSENLMGFVDNSVKGVSGFCGTLYAAPRFVCVCLLECTGYTQAQIASTDVASHIATSEKRIKFDRKDPAPTAPHALVTVVRHHGVGSWPATTMGKDVESVSIMTLSCKPVMTRLPRYSVPDPTHVLSVALA